MFTPADAATPEHTPVRNCWFALPRAGAHGMCTRNGRRHVAIIEARRYFQVLIWVRANATIYMLIWARGSWACHSDTFACAVHARATSTGLTHSAIYLIKPAARARPLSKLQRGVLQSLYIGPGPGRDRPGANQHCAYVQGMLVRHRRLVALCI